MICPLCAGADISSVGFRGLGLMFKCLTCCTIFIESTSLEDDLLQSERK